MVRKAIVDDAEQLRILNNEFNGEGETTIENIKKSLMKNQQEVVIVDDENGVLTGFVCVQLKRSFCYNEYMPEITEVYVRSGYRKQGIASKMLVFAEKYCIENYLLCQYELLTDEEKTKLKERGKSKNESQVFGRVERSEGEPLSPTSTKAGEVTKIYG